MKSSNYIPVSAGSLIRVAPFLPTEIKVESGTSQRKSGTSVDSSNSGYRPQARGDIDLLFDEAAMVIHPPVQPRRERLLS